MIRTDTPRLDRAAIRRRTACLRAVSPCTLDRPEGVALLLACAADVPALLDALDVAEADAARQAETAVDLRRRLTSALLLIDRAAADPARAATLRHDLRVTMQSSQDPAAPDSDRRRVRDALDAIGPVDVGLLPGQAGDILRKVHAALTGTRADAGVPA